MTISNTLFSIVESGPVSRFKPQRADLHYMLTLIVCKEETSLLFLTSPGCRPLLPAETAAIETILQIVFSDFLIDLFNIKAFAFIGRFLRQSSGCCRFSPETLMQVKDSIVRLRTNSGFESNTHFLYMMKTLAESDDTMSMKENGQETRVLFPTAGIINKVKIYINENFPNRIKTSDVAELAGFTRIGFSRFFKRHTGMTFNNYVTMIRIEQASRLLLRTDDTIWGIACSCGFTSPCYFNDVFKRHRGMTPGEFRNKL